jgi:hypothetical protein
VLRRRLAKPGAVLRAEPEGRSVLTSRPQGGVLTSDGASRSVLKRYG